jgi:hypothetical protein
MHLPDEPLDRVLLAIASGAFVTALSALVAVMGFQPYGHQPEIGKVAAVTGAMKRREARSLSWQDVKPGDAIFLRDTLKTTTAKSGGAVEFANGRTMELGPESTVQIEEIYPHRVEVSIYRGSLGKADAVTVRRGEALRVLPVPQKPLLALPQIISPN